jgi:hypothetical protein
LQDFAILWLAYVMEMDENSNMPFVRSPSGNSMVGEGGGNEIGYFATLAA